MITLNSLVGTQQLVEGSSQTVSEALRVTIEVLKKERDLLVKSYLTEMITNEDAQHEATRFFVHRWENVSKAITILEAVVFSGGQPYQPSI